MSTTVMENPIILNVMNSYGAILIGCFFSCVIWGVSCTQIFFYFFNYGKDRSIIKALVVFVWCMDTANQVLILKSCFPVLILQWGRVAGLTEIRFELMHHTWVAGVIAVSVQTFFLWRIYIFSGNKWIFPALLMPVVLWQVIGAIPFVLTSIRHPRQGIGLEPKQLALTESLRGISCGIDIILAIVMTWLLIRNGQSEFKSSQRLVFRLLILTINTGAWTAVLALCVLVTLLVFPRDLIFSIFEFPIGGFYVNSLLANLNARRYLKGTHESEWGSHIDACAGTDVPLSALRARGALTSQDNTMAIRVETIRAVQGDDDHSDPDTKSSKLARML